MNLLFVEILLFKLLFLTLGIDLFPGDVPGRGPAEEPGPFHRLSTHQRAPLLSGPGPAAAQSHVGRHSQLSGRVPEHPPTDPEPQPATTSALRAQSGSPESPLR